MSLLGICADLTAESCIMETVLHGFPEYSAWSQLKDSVGFCTGFCLFKVMDVSCCHKVMRRLIITNGNSFSVNAQQFENRCHVFKIWIFSFLKNRILGGILGFLSLWRDTTTMETLQRKTINWGSSLTIQSPCSWWQNMAACRQTWRWRGNGRVLSLGVAQA